MRKTLLSIPFALFILLLSSCSKPDNSTRYISKDAIGVISINSAELLKKVGLNMLSGSPMFKELTRSAGGDTSTFALEKMGIEYMSTMYVYALPDQRLPGRSKFMAIVPIKDVEKFKVFIKERFKEAKMETKGNLSFATLDNNICIGWDKNTAIVAAASPQAQWMDDGSRQPDQNNAVILTEEIQKTFAMPADQSIAGNQKFTDMVKAGRDIGFWLNYETMVNSMPQEQIGTAGAILASQKKLLKDAYIAGGVNFEKGKIVGDATYYFNPTVKAIAEALEVKSVNNDLLNKVPGSQLNLMLSYHFNPKGFKTLADTMGVLPLANAGLKEYGLTLDDILNAFSGDFLLAVTDFAVTTESQSYTLSGSSVNYTKPVPAFKATLSFKLKDKAAFDKVMQAAISNQILMATGPNTYSVGPIVLANNDQYLVASNDAAVTSAFLQSPGKASFKVPSEVKSNPYGFFIDIRNSIQTVPLDLLYGKEDTAVFHDAKGLMESISAYGGKFSGDHTDVHFEATFTNKDENSLLQIIKFAQKVTEAEKRQGDSYDDVVPDDDTTEEVADTAATAI